MTTENAPPSKDGNAPKKPRTTKSAPKQTEVAPPAKVTDPIPAVPGTPTTAALAKDMGDSINLLSLLDADSGGRVSALEVVRLGPDETPLIPFTAEGERVQVHYCSEPEISGYARCNGVGCTLCKIGRRKDERLLIPVYLPAAGVVGVLPVSPVLRPNALFPQLGNVLKAGKPVIAFVSRDRDKFTVATAAIAPDVDAGEKVIPGFMADYRAGRIKLCCVIASYTNEQFAAVPAIARMLTLKGVA